MNWLTFAVLALATWRITHMFVKEDGPMQVFKRMRRSVGIGPNPEDPDDEIALNDSFLATVLECPLCTSVWIGLFFFAIALVSPSASFWLALPFALSAVACLIEKAENIARDAVER